MHSRPRPGGTRRRARRSGRAIPQSDLELPSPWRAFGGAHRRVETKPLGFAGVHEVVKIVGGIAWPVGFVLLFVIPTFGILVLLLAIVLSVLSIVWTRQRRHAELVQATRPPTTTPKATDARLAETEELKASGVISDAEYTQMRQRILDEL